MCKGKCTGSDAGVTPEASSTRTIAANTRALPAGARWSPSLSSVDSGSAPGLMKSCHRSMAGASTRTPTAATTAAYSAATSVVRSSSPNACAPYLAFWNARRCSCSMGGGEQSTTSARGNAVRTSVTIATRLLANSSRGTCCRSASVGDAASFAPKNTNTATTLAAENSSTMDGSTRRAQRVL
eukprot:Amastigsp_a185756_5.p2 type:complete len:183 gc:universal Amastigsp_a185756_5:49-597(+)